MYLSSTLSTSCHSEQLTTSVSSACLSSAVAFSLEDAACLKLNIGVHRSRNENKNIILDFTDILKS